MAHLKRYLSALAINLDKEIDRLYGLPLDRFTQARDSRVKELRSGGEREAADHLKQARKPTAAAWVANQLARNERMNVRALLIGAAMTRAACNSPEDKMKEAEAARIEADKKVAEVTA